MGSSPPSTLARLAMQRSAIHTRLQESLWQHGGTIMHTLSFSHRFLVPWSQWLLACTLGMDTGRLLQSHSLSAALPLTWSTSLQRLSLCLTSCNNLSTIFGSLCEFCDNSAPIMPGYEERHSPYQAPGITLVACHIYCGSSSHHLLMVPRLARSYIGQEYWKAPAATHSQKLVACSRGQDDG